MNEYTVTLEYTVQRQLRIPASDEETAAIFASKIYTSNDFLDSPPSGGICRSIRCGKTKIYTPDKPTQRIDRLVEGMPGSGFSKPAPFNLDRILDTLSADIP